MGYNIQLLSLACISHSDISHCCHIMTSCKVFTVSISLQRIMLQESIFSIHRFGNHGSGLATRSELDAVGAGGRQVAVEALGSMSQGRRTKGEAAEDW